MARSKSAEKIIPQLRKFAVDIRKLKEDPKNTRKHNQRNMQAIKDSLTRFGQRAPLIVQKTGMVVRVGNARLRAAKELGWNRIAAFVVDDDNAKALAFSIADNRTAELAEWDDARLSKEINALIQDHEISVPGFTDREIRQLFAKVEKSKQQSDQPEVVFSTELLEENQYIVFTFSNTLDWNVIKARFNLRTVHDKDSEKYGIGNRAGIGRVLDGEALINALGLDR